MIKFGLRITLLLTFETVNFSAMTLYKLIKFDV
jgi:hypothetical protein